MKYSAIIYEKKGSVAIVTLNSPKTLNSLVQAMLDDLHTVTREIAADDEVKAVILTGAGKAFCAGGDLNRFKEGFDHYSAYYYVEGVHQWCMEWINLKKPTIAAINGPAVGAGLSVALMCDFSIAAESAKMGSAFINMGLIPDLAAAYYLPRAVGQQKAKELFYTGRNISSIEALAIGLVSKVVSDDQLMYEVQKLANQIAEEPSFAISNTKRIVNASLDTDLNTLMTLESFVQGISFISEDSSEAVDAFLNKRKPTFKGK